MRSEIEIRDADKDATIALTVDWDYEAGARPRMGWRDGGDPGESPAIYVYKVFCDSVTFHFGEKWVTGKPSDTPENTERGVGEQMREDYGAEIMAELQKLMARELEGSAVDAAHSRTVGH